MIPPDVPSALLSDLAHSLDSDLDVGETTRGVRKSLEELKLPFWLENFLGFCWVRKGGYVHGGYHLNPIAKILKTEDVARLVGEHLFPIGSAANGDPIVIRFDEKSARAVGMISHEDLYKFKRYADHYYEVIPTLEEFLLRLVERRYLPIDSFAGREYTKLRDRMRREGCD